MIQEMLAALKTILKLTDSPDIMLVISIIENMTTQQFFGVCPLLFLQMGILRLESRQNPLLMTLTLHPARELFP